MSNTTDVSGDWQWWDNTEEVEVGDETVTHARRGNLAEAAREFGYVPGVDCTAVWLIPAAEAAVTVGDVITDGEGVAYRVQSVQERRLGASLSHYTCFVVTNVG